jgi:hypothetical protein
MLRCTGNATSTFGGGGGTKLFCSHALNAPEANMAKAMREATTVRSRTISYRERFSVAHACLMSASQLQLLQKRLLVRKTAFRHPINMAFHYPEYIAINPLAVKHES